MAHKPIHPRWAACSISEFGPLGERAHLVVPGALTSVCGISATHPEIWRGSRHKPLCPTCKSTLTKKRAA